MCNNYSYKLWLENKIKENAYRYGGLKRSIRKDGLSRSIRKDGLSKSLTKDGISRFWEKDDEDEKSERKAVTFSKTWKRWVRLCRNSIR